MWNKERETISREELRILQTKNLQALVKRVYENVPFYKQKFDEMGIKPEDIQDISDITKLPFTSKLDMRETYPYGLVAVDEKDIVEIHTSSGTTGKPVVAAYTENDMDMWSEVMARTYSMAGVDSSDVVQNAYGYGFFTGGLGFHYGARRIQANVLPISGGNTARQLSTMEDFKTTVLTCTPSYCLYLAEYAKENGIDFDKLHLKAGFFGAEPWSESMRSEIQESLKIKAYDIYGLTEIIGPGVGAECKCQNGLHIFEDHFYPEIIDPDTGETLPDGEKGELVLTTLTREGSPVIRYRTRDITYIINEPCECGRTIRRIHRLLGRTDDMLIIRGVNVFPTQIEQVLLKIEGVEPHYQLLIEKHGHLDYLEVQVEMTEALFSDEIKLLKETEKRIEHKLHSALGIHAKVRLVNPKSIPRSEGKAKRIIDKREVKNAYSEKE